ncbi:hypothetical protein SARC_08416, partial [Sphaeroforma arctica JP610]
VVLVIVLKTFIFQYRCTKPAKLKHVHELFISPSDANIVDVVDAVLSYPRQSLHMVNSRVQFHRRHAAQVGLPSRSLLGYIIQCTTILPVPRRSSQIGSTDHALRMIWDVVTYKLYALAINGYILTAVHSTRQMLEMTWPSRPCLSQVSKCHVLALCQDSSLYVADQQLHSKLLGYLSLRI